jgi:translation initiation factor 3 subunit D
MAAAAAAGSPAVPPALVSFPALDVAVNEGGWGPLASSVPAGFGGLPFSAFSRGERIGKAADFGGFLSMRQRGNFRRGMDENVELGGALYEQGDSEFVTVDTAKAPKRGGFGGGRGRGGARGGFRGGRGGAQPVGARGWEDKQNEHKGSDGTSFNKRYNKLTRARWVQNNNAHGGPRLLRDASVRVGSDWLQLELFDLAQFGKLQVTPGRPEDLRWFGALEQYDEDFDRCMAKKPTRLRNFPSKAGRSVGSRDDPVFQELAAEEAGNVFATESVLGHLMAGGRSIYPWDIVIHYVGGAIFLDARKPQDFDLHSANENSHHSPEEVDEEAPNGRSRLAVEATVINHDFSQQVLLPNSRPDAKAEAPAASEPRGLAPNPLYDPAEMEPGSEVPSGALRYRRWALGKDTTVVVRTSLHAVSRKRSEAGGAAGTSAQLLRVHTLNEWDSKQPGAAPDWRKLIDVQRGNVLATEMKNNGFKLAKLTAQSLLAGAEGLKLGFVSRARSADPEQHVIVGVQTLNPQTFAHQMSLDPNNMWGIVKWLVELVRKHAANLQSAETGEEAGGAGAEDYQAKFVLLRDPNFPRVSLFNVPLEVRRASGGGFALAAPRLRPRPCLRPRPRTLRPRTLSARRRRGHSAPAPQFAVGGREETAGEIVAPRPLSLLGQSQP